MRILALGSAGLRSVFFFSVRTGFSALAAGMLCLGVLGALAALADPAAFCLPTACLDACLGAAPLSPVALGVFGALVFLGAERVSSFLREEASGVFSVSRMSTLVRIAFFLRFDWVRPADLPPSTAEKLGIRSLALSPRS